MNTIGLTNVQVGPGKQVCIKIILKLLYAPLKIWNTMYKILEMPEIELY